MRRIKLADLPDDAVTIDGNVATFELPNPDNPQKPLTGTLVVVGGELHVFDARSSLAKRFLAYHGL